MLREVGSPAELPSAAAPALAVNTQEQAIPAPAAGAQAPQLDLWCLSVPGVLLLTQRTGLDPQARRFLRDLIRAVGGRYQVAPRQANFRWPQPDVGDLPVAGALRGLTQRLLGEQDETGQSKDTLLLLLGSATEGVELPFTDAQTWQLEPVAELMASASSKRALWQRVQQR